MVDRRPNAVIAASIFMGYILVFLVCHSPRLMLNIYELFTIRQAMQCQAVGFTPFPVWPQVSLNSVTFQSWSLIAIVAAHPQVFTAFSELFLVLNSSINILIYSLLSSRFRDEVVKGVGRIRRCQ